MTDNHFASIPLRRFHDPANNLVLNAPVGWTENREPPYQVCDDAADTQFTSNAFPNTQQLSLEAWSALRISAVQKNMPYMQQVCAAYPMQIQPGPAMVAQFRGVFPGSTVAKHYLVLCLRTDKLMISLTITSPEDHFARNDAFYRWLLTHQLSLHEALAVKVSDILPRLVHIGRPELAGRIKDGRVEVAGPDQTFFLPELIGDLAVSYTVPGSALAASLPSHVMHSLGFDASSAGAHGDYNFQIFLGAGVPVGGVGIEGQPMYYYAMNVAKGMSAGCLAVKAVWDSVASMVNGELRIMVPAEGICFFSGTEQPGLQMMTDIARELHDERPETSLSRKVFAYRDGAIVALDD